METRTLGRTDLVVTRLGFGGARIGLEDVNPDRVGRVLNRLLDDGITLIDTAACYHDSEELIGRYIGGRRNEYVLATKCGHVTGDATGEPWTRAVIEESIDRSLQRLRTDHVDLVQLHTCSADVLRTGEAVDAVMRAKEAGKTRYVGYSGDGDDALEAIRMGVFSTLQTSFNLVDQKGRADVLPEAKAAEMGVIAKRPIANGAIGQSASPYGYADAYFKRARQLEIPDGAPEDPIELSLRFTLSQDAIDTAIVGTTNPDHARDNLELTEKGPLANAVLDSFYSQFDALGAEWNPQT
jgi:aryl-alcohol dehydrogenase-like predicted oxidoreductase